MNSKGELTSSDFEIDASDLIDLAPASAGHTQFQISQSRWAVRHSRLLACSLSVLFHSLAVVAIVWAAIHALRPVETPPIIEFAWGEQGMEGSGQKSTVTRPDANAPLPTVPAYIQTQDQKTIDAIAEASRPMTLQSPAEVPHSSALSDSSKADPNVLGKDSGDGGAEFGGALLQLASGSSEGRPRINAHAPQFGDTGTNGVAGNGNSTDSTPGGHAGFANGTLFYQSPRPIYPPESRRLGEQGTVVVEVEILPNGSLGEIKLITSSGFPRLDTAAIEYIKNQSQLRRPTPATFDGQPVASTVRVPINYVLRQPR